MRAAFTHANGMETHIALQDGNLVTGTVQDCTPILEDTKARHLAGLHGSSEMRHAATIPNVVIEQYCNARNLSMQEFWKEKQHLKAILNDPGLKAFRIWPGRV